MARRYGPRGDSVSGLGGVPRRRAMISPAEACQDRPPLTEGIANACL